MSGSASYRYDLGGFRYLYLSNQGTFTTVTLYSGNMGQQQQSSQSITTGTWQALPQVYQLGNVYVATIFAEQTLYLSIQGSQIQISSGASGASVAQQISQLDPLPRQSAEPPSGPTMEPMTPMQPMTMTMGDMSMSMGDMSMGNMRMGNMGMGAQASSSHANSPVQNPSDSSVKSQSDATGQKKFCSQCGAPVGASDRFCSQCGYQLT